MSRAELNRRSTPAPVAGIERKSLARLASAGNSVSWSLQKIRGLVSMVPIIEFRIGKNR
jgi:hypothetical protein